MKRILAVLLTLAIALTLTGVAAFADSGSLPEFTGGKAVLPISAIPAELTVGDALTFSIHPDSFVFGDGGGFDFGSPALREYLAGLEVIADTSYFTVTPFSHDGSGVITFGLVAAAATDGALPFSVAVRDTASGNSTEPYIFNATVAAPVSNSDTNEEPEEIPVVDPEPVVVEDCAYITGLAQGSAPVLENWHPTLNLGDRLLFYIPDDNFTWSSETGVKVYNINTLSAAATQIIKAPAEFTRQFVMVDGRLFIELTASVPGTVENGLVGIIGGMASFDAVILGGETDDTGGGETQTNTEEPQTKAVEPEADTGDPDAKIEILEAEIGTFMIASAITTDTIGIKNGAHTKWERVGTIADPDIVNTGSVLTFKIPDDNFEIGTGDPAANIDYLNKNCKGNVVIISGGENIAPLFGINFRMHENNYAVDLTTPGKAMTLPAGSTIGFSAAASEYTLDKPMYISSVFGRNATISSGNKIDGIAGVLGDSTTLLLKNGVSSGDDLTALEPAAGDDYIILLSSEFFTWSDGDPSPAGTVTSTVLRRSKVTVRVTSQKNSKLFDAIELTSKNNSAGVRVRFVKPFVSTKEMDFKAKIYLSVGGKRYDDCAVLVEGTLANIEDTYYSDDTDIDLSEGNIGVIEEAIKKAEVYIGEDVTILVPSLRRNSKIYGYATLDEENEQDDDYREKYPDIEMIYHLYTIGLNGAGSKVVIQSGNDGYYVYGADLKYLGRSKDKLEYSTVYYFASKKLDVPDEGIAANDVEEEGDDLPEPVLNKNDNPYTGK